MATSPGNKDYGAEQAREKERETGAGEVKAKIKAQRSQIPNQIPSPSTTCWQEEIKAKQEEHTRVKEKLSIKAGGPVCSNLYSSLATQLQRVK